MTQGPINREVAFAGLQVRRKVIFALTLCSLLPLMLLTYAFSAPVREWLGPLAGLAGAVLLLTAGAGSPTPPGRSSRSPSWKRPITRPSSSGRWSARCRPRPRSRCCPLRPRPSPASYRRR